MDRNLHPVGTVLTGLALALSLLTPGAAQAAAPTSYKIQRIAKLGDRIGPTATSSGFTILSNGDFQIGTLNDRGQLVFVTENGKVDGTEILLQYADGQLNPIVIAGGVAPGGHWPSTTPPGLGLIRPVSMNQRGDLVFAVWAQTPTCTSCNGTFRWDYQAREITPLALPGMPATGGWTFDGDWGIPAINDSDEIAFPAHVKSGTSGGGSGNALFFRGRDGTLQPVLLPGQELSGGGKLEDDSIRKPTVFSLTNSGRVAFLARAQGVDRRNGAFVWEQGTISPVLVPGTALPGGGTVGAVSRVLLNDKDRSVLVAAEVAGTASGPGLYRVVDGQATPVAVPGQLMPDGSKLRSLGDVAEIGGRTGVAGNGGQTNWPGDRELDHPLVFGVSAANGVGQSAFVATLDDGATAAYRIETDGSLSLIVKSGATSDLEARPESGI